MIEDVIRREIETAKAAAKKEGNFNINSRRKENHGPQFSIEFNT
jgi:hypothetical protein